MQNLIDKARAKNERDKKIIALTASGIIVAIIFVIWTSSLSSRLGASPTEEFVNQESKETQKASAFNSAKRKAILLFGEGSPLRDLELDMFSRPIEYNKEENTTEKEKNERDLDMLLEEFNATTTSSTSTISTTSESGL